LEQQLLTKGWQEAPPGVQVKLLPQGGVLEVRAESADRMAKQRAIRRRQLKIVGQAQANLDDAAQARRAVDEARRRPLARAKGKAADRNRGG
jgi:hypothetical protein